MSAFIDCNKSLEVIELIRNYLSRSLAALLLWAPDTSQVESIFGEVKLFPSWAKAKEEDWVGRLVSPNILQRHSLNNPMTYKALLSKSSAPSQWHYLGGPHIGLWGTFKVQTLSGRWTWEALAIEIAHVEHVCGQWLWKCLLRGRIKTTLGLLSCDWGIEFTVESCWEVEKGLLH